MKLIAHLAAAAAALVLAAPALAHHPKHARWHDLSLAQKHRVVVRDVRRERSTIRWWLRNRQRFPLSGSAPYDHCASIGIRAPAVICLHGQRLVSALHVLRRIDSKLAAIARARELAARPAHYALWRCIAGYPGERPGGGPGESWGNPAASNGSHFNVLQMTMPWGKGSYYVADPIHASAEEVIGAAERGYAANDYSRSWLTSQWGQTISPCWAFA